MKTPALLTILLISAFLINGAVADTPEKRGWYWYEPIPVAEEENDEVAENKEQRQPLPEPPPMEELMSWHPDEVKDALEKYHKQAIWQPTEENMKWYLRFEDVALRKSVAVAAVKKFVVQTNPEFDLNKDYPNNKAGQNVFYTQRSDATRDYLKGNRGRYGLVYFVQESCAYCRVQDSVVKTFLERYQYEIAVVDIKQNPLAAERFNVDFTPQIILVERQSKNWMTVASGVVPIRSLEDSTYRAIRVMRKEIKPEQFFTTEAPGRGALDPLRAERESWKDM